MEKTILIGTSGWHYQDWQGSFYKSKLSGYDELKYFSTQFKTVENNSAFYHVPRASTFRKWYESTEDNFVFSVKLNKKFTHDRKLILGGTAIKDLGEYLANTQELKEKLGVILIQTPPSLKYSINLLKEFVETIAAEASQLTYRPEFAVEFRNKSWFTDDVYTLLKEHNVAWTIGQSSRYPYERITTADFSYIRFHGPKEMFASSYSEKDLDEWADYITGLPAGKVYVYFNNTMHAYALKDATYLNDVLK